MTETAQEARRRLRRAKDSERRFGKWLIEHDGPDPRLRPGGGVVSTTGRVGHITGLQYDCHSFSYAGENKHQQVWAGLWGFWLKVVGVAIDNGKHPLIRIEPTNAEPTEVRGRRVPVMHIITEERHAELLGYERAAREAQNVAPAAAPAGNVTAALPSGPVRGYSKADQVKRSPGRRK